jgi:hypothetical protein
MSDQNRIDAGNQFESTCLEQPLAHSRTRIDKQGMTSGLEQNRRPVAIERGPRCPGAEKSQSNLIVICSSRIGVKGSAYDQEAQNYHAF